MIGNFGLKGIGKNTLEDADKIRRKQAEFLVKSHVPVKCIGRIIVYNENSRNLVQRIVTKLGLKLDVDINPNQLFYYQ